MGKMAKTLCLILSMAMIFAACSSGGGGNGSSTGGEPVITVGDDASEGATAPTAELEHVDRDDVIFCLHTEAASLDPLEGENASDWMVPLQVFDTLIRDAPGDPTTQLPRLATDWEFADDGMTLLLTIKQGVTFHNGDPLTVEDVVWSLNRAFAAPVTQAYTTMILEAVEHDENTVALKLKYPYEPVLKILTNATMAIQSKAYVESGVNYSREPIGTGPYKMNNWITGEKIELEAYEGYHGDAANIKNLTIQFIGDQTTAGIAMENNEVDAFFGVATADLPRFREDPNLQVLSARSFTFYSLWFNTEDEIFKDKAVRQAISYAMDRQAIIDGGMDGVGWTIECPMGSGIFGYQENFKNNEYDLEKAKELLAEAGYPDGFDCVMKCTPEDYVSRPAQVVQEQLRKMGINCELEIMERGAYLEDVTVNGNFQLIFAGSGALYADADSVTYKVLHSSTRGAGGNWSLYSNPEMDRLLDEARTELDTDKRNDLYLQISELCKEDAPIIPLCQSTNTLTAWKDLLGTYGHPATKYICADWYWN